MDYMDFDELPGPQWLLPDYNPLSLANRYPMEALGEDRHRQITAKRVVSQILQQSTTPLSNKD